MEDTFENNDSKENESFDVNSEEFDEYLDEEIDVGFDEDFDDDFDEDLDVGFDEDPDEDLDEDLDEDIEKVDILDILLDEENHEPVTMYDSKGQKFIFDQVSIIPHERNGEEVLYAILKPITPIPGVKDDEDIVFYVDEDSDGEAVLKVEVDEVIADKVFDKYYDLLDEA